MLGSASDADDAVQEAWLRLSRSDADSIEHLSSWLTTVLSRVCLNILQAGDRVRRRRWKPMDSMTRPTIRQSQTPSRKRCLPTPSVLR